MTDRDDRIRELAYFMWREEGCREGHDERHWLAAEILLESEDLDRKRIEPIGDAQTLPVSEAQAVPGGPSATSRIFRRRADSEKEQTPAKAG